MNTPTPAIVAQQSVRRFPRWALLAIGFIYVVAGFVGRAPWKAADITSYGYMMELTQSGHPWWYWPFTPSSLGGLPPEIDSPLGYALGAWFIELFTNYFHFLSAESASRVPFIALFALTLLCTWHSVYQLALSPKAAPVQFAFGGQANSKDYALTLADASVLALISALGLAQLGHEITPSLAQLCMVSMLMLSLSLMVAHPYKAQMTLCVSLVGLSLTGAPSLSIFLGLAGAIVCAFDQDSKRSKEHFLLIIFFCFLSAALSEYLHLWQWRITAMNRVWAELPSVGRLWIWFYWPLWPLLLWTLWRWRNQWASKHWSRHLITPLVQCLIISGSALLTLSQERTFLLALPSMAALSIFALPTLGRSVKALIDWFTLLLFSSCAFVIWVIWIAYQTGWPTQPARNVERLVPGFVSHFEFSAFFLAVIATLSWFAVVHWRIGRNPAALWKTLVLPASGAALCWLLVMSLWLSPVDYARSYVPLSNSVKLIVQDAKCTYSWKLTRPQMTALKYQAHLNLVDFKMINPLLGADMDSGDRQREKITPDSSNAIQCSWIIASGEHAKEITELVDLGRIGHWQISQTIRKPSDPDEDLVLFAHQ